MKKGATHADWAVSLGIFLIYILSLFILIQPGIEPIFRNENLIKIAESSFFNETRLTIEKTPLIFRPIEIESGGEYIAEIEDNIPFSGEDLDLSDFYVTDDQGNPLPFDMSFGEGNTIVNQIRVSALFSTNNPTTVYIYYSTDAYELPPQLPAVAVIGEELPRLNFTRTFGSMEVMSGINKNIISVNPLSINFLCTTPEEYSLLKEQWNYPSNKDFQIFMISTPNPRYTLEDINNVCSQAQPFEQASVFVQERVDTTLDRFGNREPLRINLRVW